MPSYFQLQGMMVALLRKTDTPTKPRAKAPCRLIAFEALMQVLEGF
jgi:hypothetical protein